MDSSTPCNDTNGPAEVLQLLLPFRCKRDERRPRKVGGQRIRRLLDRDAVVLGYNLPDRIALLRWGTGKVERRTKRRSQRKRRLSPDACVVQYRLNPWGDFPFQFIQGRAACDRRMGHLFSHACGIEHRVRISARSD